jgi:ribosomal protein S18 acetylase RimI-like enzyme
VRTDLGWSDYKTSGHQEFAELIQETYSGSLDCPALTGLREIEDIIAGHKAVGLFQPHRWRLARVDGRPAGCILLGENPLRRIMEVAYMGVHPTRRREGLGHVLIEEAFRLAYHERFEKVTLAVDAKNGPALRLYHGAGFLETIKRGTMILCNQAQRAAKDVKVDGPSPRNIHIPPVRVYNRWIKFFLSRKLLRRRCGSRV